METIKDAINFQNQTSEKENEDNLEVNKKDDK